MNYLRKWLTHPLLKGLDIDDPRTTILRRSIIKENGLLRQIYESWYDTLLTQIPQSDRILELGSGGGFLNEIKPKIISSEVFFCPHVQIILNGEKLPFDTGELSAIVMTNVLHHIPNVRKFFTEAARCLKPGGSLAMVEPWNTHWSKLIYNQLHHEPFDPHAPTWEFSSTGPLSSANGALPWLVFKRDRTKFESEFPEFRIQTIQPLISLRYLVSGGVSMRPLMPFWSYHFWNKLETLLEPWSNILAIFAYINICRVDENNHGMKD